MVKVVIASLREYSLIRQLQQLLKTPHLRWFLVPESLDPTTRNHVRVSLSDGKLWHIKSISKYYDSYKWPQKTVYLKQFILLTRRVSLLIKVSARTPRVLLVYQFMQILTNKNKVCQFLTHFIKFQWQQCVMTSYCETATSRRLDDILVSFVLLWCKRGIHVRWWFKKNRCQFG